MCPACITTVAVMVAGATSTGGNTYNHLDLTVLGRQDNQEGNPQAWIHHHDKYSA